MRDSNKIDRIMYLFGIIPVLWIALLVAPHIDGGLIEIIKEIPSEMENPFRLTLCKNSIRVSLFFILVYGIGIAIYESSKKNYRRREEHGSAKWGNAKTINKKYMQFPVTQNKILTQNVSIGLNAQKHRRNLNILVCGGSRSRKNEIFCKTKYYE